LAAVGVSDELNLPLAGRLLLWWWACSFGPWLCGFRADKFAHPIGEIGRSLGGQRTGSIPKPRSDFTPPLPPAKSWEAPGLRSRRRRRRRRHREQICAPAT